MKPIDLNNTYAISGQHLQGVLNYLAGCVSSRPIGETCQMLAVLQSLPSVEVADDKVEAGAGEAQPGAPVAASQANEGAGK
ncbi:MAG: hypothetical protein ACRCU5_13810 [Rhizobiaceae bacterium]